MKVKCVECDCSRRLLDTDPPPLNRTQANIWKAICLEQQRELVKANKGLRRLSAKYNRLLERFRAIEKQSPSKDEGL